MIVMPQHNHYVSLDGRWYDFCCNELKMHELFMLWSTYV